MREALMADSEEQAAGTLLCKTFFVRGLFQVLQAMKTGTKQQVCSVSIASDGITFRWEDDSKTLQCSVFLKSEVSACITLLLLRLLLLLLLLMILVLTASSLKKCV